MGSPLNLISHDGIGSYSTSTASPTKSILNGTKFYFHPGNKKEDNPTNANIEKIHAVGDQDIYDTSINSIIDYSANYPAMRLKAADFAYLSDVGRYPNNRLIIARRFRGPVNNDLTNITNDSLAVSPLSTMVGWVDEKVENFFEIDFGEGWEDSTDGLTEILESVFNAESVGKGAAMGIAGVTSMLSKVVPLSGLSRGLQTEIYRQLGLTDQTPDNLAAGNPNLINEAKRRKVGDKGGQSLTSNFEIKFKTRYEQKFINNVDPTIVFLDIINNALRFGTSNSDFFITGKGGTVIKDFFTKFRSGKWDEAIGVIIDILISVMGVIVGKVKNLIKNANTALTSTSPKEAGEAKDAVVKQFKTAITTISRATISRYKVQITGVIAAMTGEPSAPWHVTIGNPKRPFFSSGDLFTDNVKISFGNRLGFNNLPSTIDIEFTLKQGRNLGAQEIFEKFSIGGGRSYLPIPDPLEVSLVSARNDIKDKKNEWVSGKDWASGTELSTVDSNASDPNAVENKAKNTGAAAPEVGVSADATNNESNQLNKETLAEKAEISEKRNEELLAKSSIARSQRQSNS